MMNLVQGDLVHETSRVSKQAGCDSVKTSKSAMLYQEISASCRSEDHVSSGPVSDHSCQ